MLCGFASDKHEHRKRLTHTPTAGAKELVEQEIYRRPSPETQWSSQAAAQKLAIRADHTVSHQ